MNTINWQSVIPHWLSSTLLQGVVVTDTRLHIGFWNRWLEKHSGHPAATMVGKSLFESYPDLQQRQLDSYYTQALNGEEVTVPQREHGYLLAMPAPTGYPEFAQMQQRARIGPLRISGQIVGTITMLDDLTDRARQDRQLKATIAQQEENLALLDVLLGKAPIGFAFLDSELRYIRINDRLAAINGQSAAQHIGRTPWQIVPELADAQAALLQRVLATGEALVDVELYGEMATAPGVVRSWLVSCYPVHSASQGSLGVGLLMNEITERKHEEETRRFFDELNIQLTQSLDYSATLHNLAQVAVPYLGDWCMLDMIGEIPEQKFGATAHVDPTKARLADEILHYYTHPLLDAQLTKELLAAGQPVLLATIDDEIRVALAHDARHNELLQIIDPHSCILAPLLSAGRPIGTLFLARSESHRPYTQADLGLAEEVARRAALALENVRLYAAAQQSRVIAEEAVRLRDGFFSIAAHELRTPLTTLLGRAQLLQRWISRAQDIDERSARTMQIVLDQAHRLNKMITALLDVSRIQTGRFSIEAAPLDLRALVRRVVEESRLSLTEHTIVLRAGLSPLIIHGDEVRLEQMLQNLISNAIKYSLGGGEIAVSVDCGDGVAVIKVQDNGIGIPPASQQQLFHRFYRADNAEAYGISGMGIGLFVVKEIVDLHGGSIVVRSEQGNGSSFTVWLPLPAAA